MIIPIYVVGYPRSGTAWIARMLAEALDSPVSPLNGVISIACEGQGRSGEYRIYHTHMALSTDINGSRFAVGSFAANPMFYTGERVVHILRDPRALAVSNYFYWRDNKYLDDIGSVIKAIEMMANGNTLAPYSWLDFVDNWISSTIPYAYIRYEALHADTLGVLTKTIQLLEIEPPKSDKLKQTVHDQSFAVRSAMPDEKLDKLPYGKDIQRHHMRSGMVGDWRNYFHREEAELAEHYFGDHLRKFGYETDPDWWKQF